MKQDAANIVDEVANEFGVVPRVLTSRGYKRAFVYPRIKIAMRLSALGYSANRISRILSCHHTTVLFYLGRLKKKPKPEQPKPLKVFVLLHHGAIACCLGQPETQPRKKRGLIRYAGFDRHART